jgi:hypothetical protein
VAVKAATLAHLVEVEAATWALRGLEV